MTLQKEKDHKGVPRDPIAGEHHECEPLTAQKRKIFPGVYWKQLIMKVQGNHDLSFWSRYCLENVTIWQVLHFHNDVSTPSSLIFVLHVPVQGASCF